jgi:hypothetical protein
MAKKVKRKIHGHIFFNHLALKEISKYMSRFMIGISITKDKNN